MAYTLTQHEFRYRETINHILQPWTAWEPCTASNTSEVNGKLVITVPNKNIRIGHLQVRVMASAAINGVSGYVLTNATPYTAQIQESAQLVNLVSDGDSITQGNYPGWTDSFLPATGYDVTNVGASGQTIVGLRARAATTVDAKLVPGAINIYSIMAGTNDINGGATAATVASNLQAYHQERIAAGWDAGIQLTVTHRANLMTEVNALNVLIRDNYLAWGATSLVDAALNPSLANSAVPYVFSDGLHPTIKGQEYLGHDLYEGLNSALIALGEAALNPLAAMPVISTTSIDPNPAGVTTEAVVWNGLVGTRGIGVSANPVRGYFEFKYSGTGTLVAGIHGANTGTVNFGFNISPGVAQAYGTTVVGPLSTFNIAAGDVFRLQVESNKVSWYKNGLLAWYATGSYDSIVLRPYIQQGDATQVLEPIVGASNFVNI